MTTRNLLIPFAPIISRLILMIVSSFLLLEGNAFATPNSLIIQGTELQNQGNYKEAYESFSKALAISSLTGNEAAKAIHDGSQCLISLQRLAELDRFIEEGVRVHSGKWEVLQAAARQFSSSMHYGYIVSGTFSRGWARGGEVKTVSSADRDRVRALQLLLKSIELAEVHGSAVQASALYLEFAAQLQTDGMGNMSAWKLQAKTDLTLLPDYEQREEMWIAGGASAGAPVDSAGNPIYYSVPSSFESAKNDGERWRWCLQRAGELDSTLLPGIQLQFASFLDQQFGTSGLAQSPIRIRDDGEPGSNDTSGTFALHTLKENETITRLATGVHRFTLPDEFNFIRILREVSSKTSSSREAALERLVTIFEDRRQYPQAASELKRTIELFGKGPENATQKRLDQIVGAWAEFEPTLSQPAGKNAAIDLRFRNGTSVTFTAHEIMIDELLRDTMNYLKSNPEQLDWHQVDIDNIGYRLVEENQAKYLGKQVASWSTALAPRPSHFDTRITIQTPLNRSGAYLLTSKIAGGNESKIVIWLNDTAIAKKPVGDGILYFVADGVTGAPIKDATLSLFGYEQRYGSPNSGSGRNYTVSTSESSGTTDANGTFVARSSSLSDNKQWLAIARTKEGRFAYLGFNRVWFARYRTTEYAAQKAFGITDRPVYRPEQNIHYKLWLRSARYEKDGNDFASSSLTIRINNPRGEKVSEQSVLLDAWGGYEGSLKLDKDAPLGVYSISASVGFINFGSPVSFRLEEYKKPEFEVSIDAPATPVSLGDTIKAKVSAKYLFGAPVTKATVRYKVQRFDYEGAWFPAGRWDWLYGSGYWWFGADYIWFPGFREWGCFAPHQWWIGRTQWNPPELIQQREVQIGADGTFSLDIDTQAAKELHSDTDHRYEITAEVVDESRRVITGSGSVLVARSPFKVHSWVDKGYYRTGETVIANFLAQTLDSKPVEASGTLELLSITYDKDRNPVEKAVQTWQAKMDAQGQFTQTIKASRPGQYRISMKVRDAAGHLKEGAAIFSVFGDALSAPPAPTTNDFRFNEIELTQDKREYSPGEQVQLQIRTDQPDSHVLLFTRPADGTYLEPKIISLHGQSAIVPILVDKKDMPNFFIEAITIHNGLLHSVTREIIVPPENKMLQVSVQPSKKEFKPGEPASVAIKIVDGKGEPVSGPVVLSVYDRAVDYIAGGSNVTSIRDAFWKWRRSFTPSNETNLSRQSANLIPVGQVGMSAIGAFGETVADEESDAAFTTGNRMLTRGNTTLRTRQQAMPMEMAAPVAAAGAAPMGLGNGIALSDALVQKSAGAESGDANSGAQQAALAQPLLRTEFADTAYWNGMLMADKDGTAHVTFTMPENLTTWKLRTWAMGPATQVGEDTQEVITTKKVLIRLQSPRFFVEKDEVVLSGIIHNYLAREKSVTTRLQVNKESIQALDGLTRIITVPAQGEVRVDWRVKVVREGTAVVRMDALTDEESDATEMKFPVFVHGALKTESFSVSVAPTEQKRTFTFTVPSDRRIDQSKFQLRFTPTLAGAMIDALPYLVNFPYGCTEQTLNRFLPTAITLKVLQSLGTSLEAIKSKRTNLNAQELGDASVRAAQWKRYEENPVFDNAKVSELAESGLKRLIAMQLSDGGWGWFAGTGAQSSAHISATVLHGLQVGRGAGLKIPADSFARGIAYLRNSEASELQELKNAPTKTKPWKLQASDLDALVHLVLTEDGGGSVEMFEMLFRDKNGLSVYAKALLGLAAHKRGDKEKLDAIMRNLQQYVVQDNENQTAYLNLGNQGYWWYWYGSEIEAHAAYLKLLVATDPRNSVASGLVKYLLNNRKNSTYWNSTRDTALVVESFSDYLLATKELGTSTEVTILLDGVVKKRSAITPEHLFDFDNILTLEGEELTAGEHTITVEKTGTGPLYANAYLTNFSLEDPIRSAGLEIKVRRKFFKLVPKQDRKELARGSRGQAIEQSVERFDREEIPATAALKSGDLVEVELSIDSKNDYEYLIFEDMKPAGLEPVEVRSGYTANDLGAYVEFRDERVAFFVQKLPRGSRSVSYRMRAETPGTFSALPTKGSAMYAPELRANSDEDKLRVVDR